MKLFVTLWLSLLLFMSRAQAQDPANAPQEPREIKVALQKGGKNAAFITCRGDVTFQIPCRFDASTNTFIFAIPDEEMVFEGNENSGARYDEKNDIMIFPGEVKVYTRSGNNQIGMNVLTAAGASVKVLPPTL
jgi:hypothetical protein